MGEARRRKAPEPDRVAAGLAATLTAILRRYDEHERELAAQPSEPVEWVIESASSWRIEDIPPRWMDGLKQVQRDPIRFWLKSAVREIGWRAYAEGGLDFMRRVSDLAQDAGANGGLIDHWWDNIGIPNSPGGCWWS